MQTQSSVDELKIRPPTTSVTPPWRLREPARARSGAFDGANTVILSVVDITLVRMVANLVEKDVKRVQAGVSELVELTRSRASVHRQVSRVAPVFERRRARRRGRLKFPIRLPAEAGHVRRVRLTVDRRPNALGSARRDCGYRGQARRVLSENRRQVPRSEDGLQATSASRSRRLTDGQRS